MLSGPYSRRCKSIVCPHRITCRIHYVVLSIIDLRITALEKFGKKVGLGHPQSAEKVKLPPTNGHGRNRPDELKWPRIPNEEFDMTVARRQQISLDHTPYYHCTTRCVRRAFLCGDDRYSGCNFDHRKQWLEQRLTILSDVFAIDLLAYAIMSNHYHVVVKIYAEQTRHWSDDEVTERWRTLFSVPDIVSPELITLWRERLASLSWYMRCLNEPLARVANREDQCKGRFWEGRYKCQALLDEAALLKCMAYVDLNPIRAGLAKTPESSPHTSIKARIEGKARHLAPFARTGQCNTDAIPMRQQDYFALVDWSGRMLHRNKRGRIPAHIPPILECISIEGEQWLSEMVHYGRWYYRAVGSIAALQRYCQHLGQKWLKGAPGMPVLPT